MGALTDDTSRLIDEAEAGQREMFATMSRERDLAELRTGQRNEGSEADLAAWPTPDTRLLNPLRIVPTFPTSILGPFWNHWIGRQAEAVAAPIDYVGAALLACASGLIGNARWASPWAGWTEPPILWTALVGTPSAGKSPALDPVRNIVAALENEMAEGFPEVLRRYETEREAAKAQREKWSKSLRDAVDKGVPAPGMPPSAVEPPPPVRPRLWTGDATPEAMGLLLAQHAKGVLAHRDELAGWLTSFDRYSAGGERAFWVEAHGGRPFTIDRVKNPEATRIAHLSVPVLGGFQPDRLASLLFAGDDDGLHARFLFFWPDPVVPRRPRDVPDARPARAALRRLRDLSMGEGEHGEPVPVIRRFEEDAAKLFDQWRGEHVRNEPEARFASWWGKQPGVVLRLALILELLWWSGDEGVSEPSVITRAAVGAGAHLVDTYLKSMAARAYGDAALPQVERNAATLARWLLKTRPSLINARTVRREASLPGMRKADAMREAIDELTEAGWLRPVPSRASNTPGKQRSDYQVNPAIRGAS